MWKEAAAPVGSNRCPTSKAKCWVTNGAQLSQRARKCLRVGKDECSLQGTRNNPHTRAGVCKAFSCIWFRILHLRKDVDPGEVKQIRLMQRIRGLESWFQLRIGENGVNMSCSKGEKGFKSDNRVQRYKSLLCNSLFSRAIEEKKPWVSSVGWT